MVDFRLLVVLIMYLTVISAFIGAIVYDKEHQSIDKFSVQGIDYNIINNQNFTSNTTYISSIIQGITDFSGVWYQSDVGISLLETSYGDEPVIVLNNAVSDNMVYSNTYHINNSVHGDFTIWLRYTASYLNSGDKIGLVFDSSGIHIRTYFFGLPSDIFVYPYPNVNQLEDLFITTVFNDKEGIVTISLNDNQLFTIPNLPKLSLISLSKFYYAGISSRVEGFTFISIHGKFTDTSISSSSIESILDFSGSLLSAIVWQVPPEYLPLEIAFIVIGIPEIMIFVLVLALFFGR